MQYTLERILSGFLSDGFLIFFKDIEMSMELYNEKKSEAQADGLPVLNGTAVVNAMYSI